jgi:murein DD-endopeptidase MepM/ murein hydrolase activator NlpD
MARRLILLCLLALVALAPAAGVGAQSKADLDQRIAALHDRIAAARARENRLTRQIGDVTAQIRSLEARVGDVSSRLKTLQRDLDLHRQRLAKLTELFRIQTRRLDFLKSQYRTAQERLARRIVEIYESDDPTTLGVILSANSFQDALDQVDYFNQIAHQDEHIASEVGTVKRQVAVARAQTNKLRASVAAQTQVIAVRTQQQKQLQTRLLISQHSLSGARQSKLRRLAGTQADERRFISEADALAAASAALTARIQAAQASAQAAQPSPAAPAGSGGSTGAPSSSGFIWPVSGPVVSPFGYRWGRLHAGIDIGVPYGTPIHAAASGRVIYAGWEGGYGNLVVIDHGRGLATAYAHQSRIAVGVGQSVGQGQVIGYVGCTGHCFGPHLHFEVRVNGQPVDPLGYL